MRRRSSCGSRWITRRSWCADGLRDGRELCDRVQEFIGGEPLADIDYVTVVDPETLQPVDRIGDRVLVALAVRIGRTRLIDNAVLSIG